jgi:hypothetical protein
MRNLPTEYAAHVASASAADLHAFTYAQWLETVVAAQEHEQARFLRTLAAAFGLPAHATADDVLATVREYEGDGK